VGIERQEDQQKSDEYMRLARPLITKSGIQMTVENYAAWCEYIRREHGTQ